MARNALGRGLGALIREPEVASSGAPAGPRHREMQRQPLRHPFPAAGRCRSTST